MKQAVDTEIQVSQAELKELAEQLLESGRRIAHKIALSRVK